MSDQSATSTLTVRVLGPDDAAVLDNVAPDVFDHAILHASAGGDEQVLAYFTFKLGAHE